MFDKNAVETQSTVQANELLLLLFYLNSDISNEW